MDDSTASSANVLWSKREGNKVPLEFVTPVKKRMYGDARVPPPPVDDVEPARFQADMEQSRRNSEDTYVEYRNAMDIAPPSLVPHCLPH